ncbi:alpha/beta hydrolase-fold protein [Algoriphagus sp. CAU 1675]|uniref:alpha/beta hydrolase-fold protein n=1 Tax=Algoriphagus sp. CAU 1675 TaxID=3032597 RepID=UPI0023DAFBBC|nr:alpha/beta hydrolase-fold protein [Algoriphagus sp. CAU 1675]MDF2157119.1 alpha/beta hydrolase-fold protein [Algoriphagus sp. CAU 1675]
MNKFFSISFLSLFLTWSHLAAQTEDHVVGKNHWIDSNILEEKRNIQIFIPEGYEDSQSNFPVLYLLDGQRFFLHGVSLQQSFRQYELTPGFIVVGITNQYPSRFNHFGEGKEKFLAFLKEEVIPYVEEKFRVNKSERILFGWEYGAGFTFHSLLTQPDLFDAYLLASPYPILDKIQDLEKFDSLKKVLVYAVSTDEYEINHAVDQLDSLLSAKKINGLDPIGLRLENEEHRSTGYATLYHGLRHYFRFYPELQEDNLYKFLEKGGLNYAKAHAIERARRYGFAPELSLWSRFTIIRSAIRAEDFPHFEMLLEGLESEKFIDELVNSNWAYGAGMIAEFYEKNAHYEETIPIYKKLLEKNPESERLLSRIANAFLQLGKEKEAN